MDTGVLTQQYVQSVELCFADKIAGMGVDKDDFGGELAGLASALEELKRPDAELAAVLNSPQADLDPADLKAIAEDWRGRFKRVVVFGIGGSAMGARAVLALNALAPDGPEIVISDNLDADKLAVVLAPQRLGETGFLAISKSGGTAETLSQTIAAVSALRCLKGEAAVGEHFLMIGQAGETPLRRLAAQIGAPVLDHDPDLGGRFSVLSAVGALPALIGGIDVAAMRAGALAVAAQAIAANRAAEVPAAVGAAMLVALQKHNKLSQSVLLTYHDRLATFGYWYRQLWAESLGKAGLGMTPINAVGPVDQHSQLQLYLDGPVDKMFTVIAFDHQRRGAELDSALAADIGLDYLSGRQIGDLVGAMQRATIETLAERGRPVRTLSLSRLDPAGLGALFMHFLLETVFAGRLLGVNPFGQPAVEEGKRLARHYLTGAR